MTLQRSRTDVRLARNVLALAVTLWAASACHPATPAPTSTTEPAASSASTATDASTASDTSASTSPSATDDTTPAADATPPAPPAATSTPTSDASNASLPEPSTPPDAASPQAAATVVETYFALVDEKRMQDADALWTDAGHAAEFRAKLASLGMPHVEVDAPGGMQGAAGSSYVTVPVRFQPTSAPANSRPRNGEVVLRRVNDVPGSTEAQRHWHIDHIDVAMTPK